MCTVRRCSICSSCKAVFILPLRQTLRGYGGPTEPESFSFPFFFPFFSPVLSFVRPGLNRFHYLIRFDIHTCLHYISPAGPRHCLSAGAQSVVLPQRSIILSQWYRTNLLLFPLLNSNTFFFFCLDWFSVGHISHGVTLLVSGHVITGQVQEIRSPRNWMRRMVGLNKVEHNWTIVFHCVCIKHCWSCYIIEIRLSIPSVSTVPFELLIIG